MRQLPNTIRKYQNWWASECLLPYLPATTQQPIDQDNVLSEKLTAHTFCHQFNLLIYGEVGLIVVYDLGKLATKDT